MNIVSEYIDNKLYIYIDIDYDSEMGVEFFKKENRENFIKKLKKYIRDKFKTEDKAIIIINGILIGTIAISSFLSDDKFKTVESGSINSTYVNKKIDLINKNIDNKLSEEYIVDEKIKEKDSKEVVEENNNEEDNSNITDNSSDKEEKKESVITSPIVSNSVLTTPKEETVSKTPVVQEPVIEEPVQDPVVEESVQEPIVEEPVQQPVVEEPVQEPVIEEPVPEPSPVVIPSNYTITLNTNGNIETLNLEEYVIGVVAAEMPASFHSEALKSQAICARTFAMKKTQAGVTLLNSTSHQVYKTKDQMKSLWGSSYDYYYNKIESAVSATKNLVLKYNGSYIDALYHSTSNGMTELPLYVWGGSFPYLQSVSSSWDKEYSHFEKTTTFSYSEVSSKLGITINSNTQINVEDRTVSNRVNNIWIGGKLFTGVEVRSKLGLRSTDFTIYKNNDTITFTTKGFGHGVGMSQYGANGAAKNGYSYSDILKHYYVGVSIVNI